MSTEHIRKKQEYFHSLHHEGCFTLPNPWDIGSAKLLASMDFKALASTSSGFAWSQGRADGTLSRDDVLNHIRTLVDTVDLPINADYESGFAATDSELAESIEMILDTGVAGFSIEDSTGDPCSPLKSLDDAATRISITRTVIDRNHSKALLVARAENFFIGQSDLDDVIARLKAYVEAGADCLYAPGIKSRAEIEAVVSAVAPKPVNVLIGWDSDLTVQDLAELGVRRVSLGGSLARVACGALMQAAQTLSDSGRFDFLADSPSGAQLNQLFGS